MIEREPTPIPPLLTGLEVARRLHISRRVPTG